MTIRRRTYPEVLDNMLTNLTGGESAEQHPYPPPGKPPYKHVLKHAKVAKLVSVYGSRGGASYLFQNEKDFILKDNNTLEWQKGGNHPDPGSIIQVNYYRDSDHIVNTDIYTGSVIRTLSETVALEIARLHAQLEAVYKAGFIDTATGGSLEKVVALLGIQRMKAGYPTGEVVFQRASGTRGQITIPRGTRIITQDGNVEYETTADTALAPGQQETRVAVRDLEANQGLPADSLTLLPIPIVGIASVTNPAPTTITNLAETDNELRLRAKSFLHGSERATKGALEAVIARQGIKAKINEDTGVAGQISVIPQVDQLTPEQEQRLLKALEEASPAGIKVDLGTAVAPTAVDLSLLLTTSKDLLEQDLRALQQKIRDSLEQFFLKRETSTNTSISRLVGAVMKHEGVEDIRVQSATKGATNLISNGELQLKDLPTVLGTLDIADPNLPSTLEVRITFPSDSSVPDQATIESAIEQMIATLNQRNSSDLAPELAGPALSAEQTARQLGYLSLLRGITLPNIDSASATAATIAPYQVTLTVTQASGLSQELREDSDHYQMTPHERLTLERLDIEVQT